MYAFKGKVAEVLHKYIPLKGTQLQHYLGNIFSKQQLEKIFVHYRLDRVIRYGKSFPIQDKHHIFVYALLGFVYQFVPEDLQIRFIYRHFLENTDHFYANKELDKNKDLTSKLYFLLKMYYNKEIKTYAWNKGKKFYYKIEVDDIWGMEEQGSTPKIAQSKCVKKALAEITNKLEIEWKQNPISQELEQARKKEEVEKKAREKAENLKRYKEKQRKRSLEIAEKKKQRKKEAMEKDEKRRKAKILVKKRREYIEEQQRKQKLALANMSVSKRRHLQDKGLLDKGAPPKK